MAAALAAAVGIFSMVSLSLAQPAGDEEPLGAGLGAELFGLLLVCIAVVWLSSMSMRGRAKIRARRLHREPREARGHRRRPAKARAVAQRSGSDSDTSFDSDSDSSFDSDSPFVGVRLRRHEPAGGIGSPAQQRDALVQLLAGQIEYYEELRAFMADHEAMTQKLLRMWLSLLFT